MVSGETNSINGWQHITEITTVPLKGPLGALNQVEMGYKPQGSFLT